VPGPAGAGRLPGNKNCTLWKILSGTLKPSETPLSWMQETSKPFLKRYGIKFKMAQMIVSLLNPYSKMLKINPTKGVVLKLASPYIKMNVSPP